MVTLFQKLTGSGWDKNRPSIELMQSWQWGAGDKLFEGDSITASMDPNAIDSKTYNIAWPGDKPKNISEQFQKLLDHIKTHPLRKAYLGVGGNLWTGEFLNPIDYNMAEYLDSMHEMISLYKTILPADDIVVASLPYIDPAVMIFDMPGPAQLPKAIKSHIKNIQVDELFAEMSQQLFPICKAEGVRFLNIHTTLKRLWSKYGRSYWIDKVHPSAKATLYIAAAIKREWGI